ncbi:MAG TPA: hypothetical protein EYH03_05180 [Chromatiales bacterium]|nr:hypothetical protein [Chromatiales bacterium]
MAGKPLKIHTDTQGVCTLTLNRPKRANALDGELIGELVTTLDQVRADPAVRLLVLTGAGGSVVARISTGCGRWRKRTFISTTTMRSS